MTCLTNWLKPFTKMSKLLLLSLLSFQVPLSWSAPASNALMPQTDDVVLPRTVHLQRRRGPTLPRRSAETRYIIDNEHMKYIVPITVGNQTLNILIDTGSSDTWLLQSDFQCYHTFDNASHAFSGKLNDRACNFGPGYIPAASFEANPSIRQFTCYGSGAGTQRCVSGPLGYADVTINGFTAPHQIVGAVNQVITSAA
jgi:hypothetical protein